MRESLKNKAIGMTDFEGRLFNLVSKECDNPASQGFLFSHKLEVVDAMLSAMDAEIEKIHTNWTNYRIDSID